MISYGTASDSNEVLVGFSSTGYLQINLHGFSFTSTSSYAALFDGERHSVGFSWDNTNGDLAFYVDGELIDTGIGAAVGSAIDAGGILVFGQEQDSLGGGFAANQIFSGTLYDVRVWDEVRSADEIALNYQQKFDIGSLPSGLVANWQMDGFNGSGEVVDVVSANNLSIGHGRSWLCRQYTD